ncbi:MAG: hypothetical protein NTW66_00495 [Candidatus Magasanikbacteria bacterium]|nr:hypothetical protein [Candidatus Magasanikbacteria bacterium]
MKKLLAMIPTGGKTKKEILSDIKKVLDQKGVSYKNDKKPSESAPDDTKERIDKFAAYLNTPEGQKWDAELDKMNEDEQEDAIFLKGLELDGY